LRDLDIFFRRSNPFYKLYLRARDVLKQDSPSVFLRLNPRLQLVPADCSKRQCRLPTVCRELAAFIPEIQYEFSDPSYRDIYLYPPLKPRRFNPDNNLQNDSSGEHFLSKIRYEHPL
jgi:hypothetical protein